MKIGEWEGPAHELDYDMVWSDEGNICSNFTVPINFINVTT